ncbi:hypothetical protein [Rickettsia endosymbiont of Polydrusus tereticollis]|uniref:hypothetical protein n=1 Tax=Rickettsia endosymbiont of Polydrusus tereticollis TaxID=3066251 RepID=UPI0031331E0D
MTNQNNQSTKLNSSTPNFILPASKAIIFLKPLSNSISHKRRQSLITNYCRQKNFTILKIVEYKGSLNYPTLRELINQISLEPKRTVTVLVEDQLLNYPSSILLFSVLGTLSLLGLINTEIYKKSYNDIRLYESVLTQNDFLSIATFILNYALKSYENKSTKEEEK